MGSTIELQQAHLDRHNISVDWIVDQLLSLYYTACENKQYQQAIRILGLLGKHLGVFDKSRPLNNGYQVIFCRTDSGRMNHDKVSEGQHTKSASSKNV